MIHAFGEIIGIQRPHLHIVHATNTPSEEANIIVGGITGGSDCLHGSALFYTVAPPTRVILRVGLCVLGRVQGIRYPRPLSPDPNDTTASVVPGCGGRNGNDIFALVASDDPNCLRAGEGLSYGEDRDRSLVEPQLWSSVMALRRLVASCESGTPLPRGMGNTDHIAGNESGSDCWGLHTRRPSQGLETKDKLISDGEILRQESLDTSAAVTDDARPPIRQNSLTERGRTCKTQRRSASKPTLSPPTSSREPCDRYVKEPSNSETRASFKRDHSSDSLRSAGSEDGELRDVFENWSGPAVRSSKSETDISVLSGAPSRHERSKGEEGSPGQNVARDDAGGEGQVQWARGQTIHSLCREDNTLIRAVDLEAAAEEGRRLGLVAAATCLDMDEEEAALSRLVL